MQTNVLWTGLEYHSLENCLLTRTAQGLAVGAVIIGLYEQQIYTVDYHLQINLDWQVLTLDLKTQLSGVQESIFLQRDEQGSWQKNGSPMPAWQGCTDLDISLTPFTNSLPINRLQLAVQEGRDIQVVYIDILRQEIRPVHQHYTRRSDFQYKFENVPNDFEATITVDEFGLVVHYPQLFTRTHRQDQN